MKIGIILGNGINNRIGISSFSLEAIRKRFIDNIKRYMPLFEATFDTKFDETEIVNKVVASDNWGIETLAGIVYECVSNQEADDWSTNDEMRLQDLLTCMAITTIFLDRGGKIKVNYQKEKLPDLSRYDYIFTLNYFELWDEKNKAIPLHGHIDLNMIDDDADMIVSSLRMPFEKYKNAVDELSKSYHVQVINLSELVFAPSTVDKKHLICVTGLRPSNKLYVSNDLVLLRPRHLYEELKEIDSLDVFGMSPYGDENIIDIINTRNKVRVFVYNKESSKETVDWEEKLEGNFEILDSDVI